MSTPAEPIPFRVTVKDPAGALSGDHEARLRPEGLGLALPCGEVMLPRGSCRAEGGAVKAAHDGRELEVAPAGPEAAARLAELASAPPAEVPPPPWLRRPVAVTLVCLVLAAVAFLLSWVLAPKVAGDDWVRFSPEDGAFTVEMPGTPRSDERVLDSPFGAFMNRLSRVERPDDGFVVSHCALPDRFVKGTPVEAHLRSMVLEMVEPHGGGVVSQRQINLGGHPGREVHFTLPNQAGEGVARVYRVNGHAIQLLAVGRGVSPEGKDARRFLESLRLRGPLAAPTPGAGE